MLFKSAKNFTIVSLPRRLFEPYTPTKTSVIYFEKAGTRNKTYFFVVRDVGHTFGARRRSTSKNDLPYVLDAFRNETQDLSDKADSLTVENGAISVNKSSLWVYDYTEVLPQREGELEYLGDHIVRSGYTLHPGDYPKGSFDILGVNNQQGVVYNKTLEGWEINQPYKRVITGDLVYNPHRVNVGSIGVVPESLSGGITSGIYMVFKPKDPIALPSAYLLYLLKSEIYLNIIRAYDTKHGAVRANLNWEQLCRIKFVMPTKDEVSKFLDRFDAITGKRNEIVSLESAIANLIQ